MLRIFKGNFSVEDSAFIEAMDERFPEKQIVQNFNSILTKTPEQRAIKAFSKRKEVLREGWKRRGIPVQHVETLDEHVCDMLFLAAKEISEHPDFLHVLDIIEVHDDSEVIVGDFTPHDALDKNEKHRLELLALQAIYPTRLEKIERWQEFEACVTFAGNFANDVDKIQMFERYKKYTRTHPFVDLSEFDTYCRTLKWKTPEGEKAFKRLALG